MSETTNNAGAMQDAEFRNEGASSVLSPAMPLPAAVTTPEPMSMRSRAVSGTVWTLVGFVIAYAVRFLGNVICSHILLPAAFGVMQIANAILQGVVMLSDVGIGQNIVQSKRGDDPRFLNTAWTVQVIRGVLMWMVVLGLAYPISKFYKDQSLLYIIPIVGMSALVGGFNGTAIYTLNKRLDVRRLTLMQLGSQFAGVGAMIGVALITHDAWALAVAAVVQAVVRLVISHRIDRSNKNRFEWDRESLRSLLGFGSVVFISTALTFIGMQGDRLILGSQITMEELGVYGVALMISRLPLDVIVNIGNGVAFPAYSHAFNHGGNFEKVFHKIRFPLCVGGSFAMAVCAIAGPDLVRLIWRPAFHGAADFIPLLCVGALFQMLEITSGSALLAMGKIKYLAIGNGLRVVSLIAGLVIGFEINGLWGALVGMVASDGVRYLTSAFFARREGLPIFGHDAKLALLTIVSYLSASFIQERLPDLGSRQWTLVEHVLIDGFIISIFFAWPLYIVARDFLGRSFVPSATLVAEGASMRITFVLPMLGMQGGIRTVALYAQHLQRQGHTVTVVAPELRSRSLFVRTKQFWKGVLSGGGLAPATRNRVATPAPSHFDGSEVAVRLLHGRRTVLPRDVPDADVVVATWWETAEWVSQFPRSKGTHAYFVQGYEVWEGQPVRRVELTYHLPMKKIAVSDWLAGIMFERYGDTSTRVVPNGVEVDRFHAPPRGKQPRPTVGFVYSEQPIKGSDLVADAIAIVRRSVPDLRVVSFGMFPPTGLIDLPPGTDFHIRPPHEKLVATYAECDAWIFASRNEGFGLPILEAMACRTPVIATPAGAAPQIVGKGGGILVGHENAEAIAGAILDILGRNDDEWRQLSKEAHATAQKYNCEVSAAHFEATLQRIASGQSMHDPSPQPAPQPST